MPVDPEQEVEVIYFNGTVHRGAANKFVWLNFMGDRPGRSPSDVIQYRIR